MQNESKRTKLQIPFWQLIHSFLTTQLFATSFHAPWLPPTRNIIIIISICMQLQQPCDGISPKLVLFPTIYSYVISAFASPTYIASHSLPLLPFVFFYFYVKRALYQVSKENHLYFCMNIKKCISYVFNN